MSSEIKTPYAIICPNHKQVFLTKEEYDFQMNRPNSRWICPICREISDWDDGNYENNLYNDSNN